MKIENFNDYDSIVKVTWHFYEVLLLLLFSSMAAQLGLDEVLLLLLFSSMAAQLGLDEVLLLLLFSSMAAQLGLDEVLLLLLFSSMAAQLGLDEVLLLLLFSSMTAQLGLDEDYFNAHHYLIKTHPPTHPQKIKNMNCFIIQDFINSVS